MIKAARDVRALQLTPEQPQTAVALHKLGNAFHRAHKNDEAEHCYREALADNNSLWAVYQDLGSLLQSQGRFDEAATCYRKVLLGEPSNPAAHLGLAFTCLVQGNWEEGWLEYEYRFAKYATALCRLKPRLLTREHWEKGLSGATVLLHSEQGLGDTIQFARYAALVRAKSARVILRCQTSLVALFRQSAAIDQVIGLQDKVPWFDLYAYLLSLPGVVGSTPSRLPADVPYLVGNRLRIDYWRQKMQSTQGLKVGICWRGNARHERDGWRSIPFSCFRGLSEVKGIHLFSLQKEGLSGASLAPENRMVFTDLGACDLSETAAVIANLDLVISCDSAIAHLAGALGRPVWVALCGVADWRWLLESCRTPWYPSMRLFRQETIGNWSQVFDEIRRELKNVVDRSSPGCVQNA